MSKIGSGAAVGKAKAPVKPSKQPGTAAKKAAKPAAKTPASGAASKTKTTASGAAKAKKPAAKPAAKTPSGAAGKTKTAASGAASKTKAAKPAAKAPVSAAAKKKVAAKPATSSIRAARGAGKTTGVKAGKKKTPKQIEEEKRLAEEEAKYEKQQQENEARNKAVNDRLKAEAEAKAAAAAKEAAELIPDEKGIRRVQMTRLLKAVECVKKEGKTPLILDTEGKVDTFFTYQDAVTIDGHGMVVKCYVKKDTTIAEALEDCRKKLVSTLKFGKTLHIALGKSACDFMGEFSGDDTFPIQTVLTPNSYKTEEDCVPVIRESDKSGNGYFFPKEDYGVVVTSLFEVEDYEEFLQDSLPLHLLGVILIDHSLPVKYK